MSFVIPTINNIYTSSNSEESSAESIRSMQNTTRAKRKAALARIKKQHANEKAITLDGFEDNPVLEPSKRMQAKNMAALAHINAPAPLSSIRSLSMRELSSRTILKSGLMSTKKIDTLPCGLAVYIMTKWYVLDGKTYHTSNKFYILEPTISYESVSDYAAKNKIRVYSDLAHAKTSYLAENRSLELLHSAQPGFSSLEHRRLEQIPTVNTLDVKSKIITQRVIPSSEPSNVIVYEMTKVITIDGIDHHITRRYQVGKDEVGIRNPEYMRLDSTKLDPCVYSLVGAINHFDYYGLDRLSLYKMIKKEDTRSVNLIEELARRKSRKSNNLL